MGKRSYKYWVAGGFLLLAAFYFWAAAHGDRTLLTFAQALPPWFLFAATFRPRRPECLWIPLAFLFSGFGDVMGVQRQFLMQIAFFTAAHLAFIAGFVRRMRFSRTSTGFLTLSAAAVTVFFICIFPNIASPVEKVFVSLYAVVIFAMGTAAALQTGRWRTGYAVAALLFIFSDFVIAYGRFAAPVPHAGYVIMTTYYSAQLLFAVTLMRRAENP